jgi:amidohydrolase
MNMTEVTALRRRVSDILPEVIELRHALHRIPEIHDRERETCAAIRRHLSGMHLEVLPPILQTDTVGLLRGEHEGPCILLRADIDALPVPDKSGAPWSSERPGLSHACGHDGHMAILYGALRTLQEMREEIAGSIRFVFQPAEEEACGGRVLIEKGLLSIEPRPVIAYALHVWVGQRQGTLSAAPGPAMAAADTFAIAIHGRGGHAALPHRAADPVLAAAQVVTALQAVVSRALDPLEPAVLSVCRIEGGHASNVIPDEVMLEGTTRYFNRALQPILRDRLERIVGGACAAAGCTYALSYTEGYVPLVNDTAAVQRAQGVVTRLLGDAAWQAEHDRTMSAEDFAFYLAKLPGALLRLGLGETWPPLHSAEFDFNDRSIEQGIVALAGLALDICAR